MYYLVTTNDIIGGITEISRNRNLVVLSNSIKHYFHTLLCGFIMKELGDLRRYNYIRAG